MKRKPEIVMKKLILESTESPASSIMKVNVADVQEKKGSLIIFHLNSLTDDLIFEGINKDTNCMEIPKIIKT